MKSAISVAVLAALAACGVAAPAPSTYGLHEKRSSMPRLWQRSDRVDGDAILPIRIGLTQNNIDDGYIHLMDVSHPESPNFGKHWTQEEVHKMFAPAEEAVEAVRNWLIDSGINRSSIVHSDNKAWLAMDIPARKAESLFQTEYHEHVHSDTGSVRVGCDEYYLPEHLREHIDYITPGVQFSHSLLKRKIKRSPSSGKKPYRKLGPAISSPPKDAHLWPIPPKAAHLAPELQSCGRNITPPCLKALYGIPNAHRNDSVNILGLYESGDVYAQSDLDLYYSHFAPQVPQGTHPLLVSIDGGEAPVPAGSEYETGESVIDMDIAYSLIYPQGITLYQVDDQIEAPVDMGFNTFLDALDGSYCNYTAYNITGNTPGLDPAYPDPAAGGYKGPLACGTAKPTRVISVSYGWSEADTTVNYTRRQCNEFLKLGLQGHTIVYASGDYGVASFPGDDSASGCLGPDEKVFSPSFPTCPWVTNVGATRLYDNQTVLDPESAMQVPDIAPNFGSAGGFANYFPVPQYQKYAVANYFKHHEPGLPYYVVNNDATNVGANGGLYNRVGRGFPDVSANGAELLFFEGNQSYHSYGTSLAAPIWGSIITLINQERTAIGKGPVGFINPVLYENTWVFNDIKNGTNPGCNSTGFAAVEGWDPVTGLGTPKFPSLLSLFLGLP